MKALLIISGLALMITISGNDLLAQERRAETETLRASVAEDVTLAAKQANLKSNDRLVTAFIDAAASQKMEVERVYAAVPKDVRVERLARYLRAKAATKTDLSPGSITPDDVTDFHWGYIAHDVEFSPMRVVGPKSARLRSVESTGSSYAFMRRGQEITPGEVFLLPTAARPAEADLAVTFELGNARMVWTGRPAGGGPLTVMAARTSRGCEIFINSIPTGAIVYFNGKEWYTRTNTSSVRDPGTWEVTLRLDGYREWRQQRSFNGGDSWTINAVLVKQ